MPLLKIGDAPMIEWVYRRACCVDKFDKVIAAADNPENIRDFINVHHLTAESIDEKM